MFFLLLLLAVLIVWDLLKNKKIYSPGFLFNGIFFVTLFLYSFYLSDIQQPLSARTLALFFIAVAAFNLPVFASYYFLPTFKLAPSAQFGLRFRQDWLCLAVTGLFLVQAAYSGGFPLLWRLTGSSLTYFDFGIPSLTGLFYGLIIVLGAYSIYKKSPYAFFYLMIGVLIISRQVLVSMVLEGVFMILLNLKKRPKHLALIILIGAAAGIAAFSVLGNFRTGEDNFLAVAEFKSEYDAVPTSLKWVYSYMCFSLSNLNNLLSMTGGGVNMGASMFNELLPSVLTDAFSLEIAYDPYFLVVPSFTVSTAFPVIYLDFGMVGIGVFCFLLGLVTQRIYRRVIYRRSLANCLLYAMFAHNILLIFFTNMFLYLPVLSQVIFILILFRKKGEKSAAPSKTLIAEGADI